MTLHRSARLVTLFAVGLALATPALAEEEQGASLRDILAWGTTTTAYVQLVPADGHPADLVFLNELTHGNPLEMIFALELDGLVVDVEVINGIGEEPDIVTVLPPPGFVAVPERLEVDEGQTGRIEIQHALLS
ncbi:hypothetical protein [Rubellimicrobium roseum]|uniref:EfeO-type cupredoxin-like domain-containing protein n=1 Tax=Rubellimicrobium roseum TaxID=687525 RepID=A0A5C4NK07_9RHOB|nr:hypothetical protein [Rubellimicrobium roseum]TNC73728.1 hypothetical protein FHG71_04405 [Rubellimicrobium roseum]